MISAKTIFADLKDLVLIVIGVVAFVVAWVLFLVPYNLIGGGVAGIASIIQYATRGTIQLGTSYLVLNVGLVIASLLTLGRNFSIKSIISIVIGSILLNVLQGVIPENIIQSFALDNGKLMCTIVGGLLIGFGTALSIKAGGSTGGTDIIAMILNKYKGFTPGKMMMLVNALILGSSLIVPSYTASGEEVPLLEKTINIAYGCILIATSSICTDQMLMGWQRSVLLFVFSQKYEKIADFVNEQFKRGVTVFDAQGWYTKQHSKVLLIVTRKSDLETLLKIIKSIDPSAFLSVTSASGVYGNGFDQIRIKKSKLREIRILADSGILEEESSGAKEHRNDKPSQPAE